MLLSHIEISAYTSLWYWICYVGVWSIVTHQILGVPYYAWAYSKSDKEQLEILCQITKLTSVRVARHYPEKIHWVIVAWISFLLTMWAFASFYYGSELLQALFVLLVPVLAVSSARARLARNIAKNDFSSQQIFTAIRKHRRINVFFAAASIFITAFWGMLHTMVNSAFWPV